MINIPSKTTVPLDTKSLEIVKIITSEWLSVRNKHITHTRLKINTEVSVFVETNDDGGGGGGRTVVRHSKGTSDAQRTPAGSQMSYSVQMSYRHTHRGTSGTCPEVPTCCGTYRMSS